MGDQWDYLTQEKEITDTFLTFLASDTPDELKTIKVFEVIKTTGQFILIVTDHNVTKLYAKLQFSYRKRWDPRSQSDYHVGYVELLHVVKKDIRKSGIGSALLRYTLNKDYSDIPYVELYACPFDYTDPIARSEKLPKLLGFYQRHGGIIINQTSESANLYFNLPKNTAVATL